MSIFKNYYTKEEWIESKREETLNLILQEEYGIRPKEVNKPFTYKLVEERVDGNIHISRMNMFYKANPMEFFIYRKDKDTKKRPTFIQICHPYPFEQGKDFYNDIDSLYDTVAPVREIIDNGFNIAILNAGTVAYDKKGGEYSLLFEELKIERNDEYFGVLSAWSLGLSKILDYLYDKDYVDNRYFAAIGHSRGGKTALITGAQDERFILSISNDSGNSGAALSRGNTGEKIADITRNFPYWFATNYQKYANNENALPFDQHMLIGLIAPRYVSVGSAALDSWADPDGELQSARFASQYFELYGVKGLVAPENVERNKIYDEGHISYHIRDGHHHITPFDWKQYMHYFQKIIKENK